MVNDPLASAWVAQRAAIGAYIRNQRELSNLSLRELARLTRISNAYLSQLERGLHDPSVRVLVSIADALNVGVEDLLQSGHKSTDRGHAPCTTGASDIATAIRGDAKLSTAAKDALLAVYRSYLRDPGED